MMRERKYRAWNGESMEYGGFSIHATGGIIIDTPGLTRVTKDSPLMEYTGLKDKNGKEIWEGDRIDEYNGHVVFELGAFWINHMHGETRKKTLLYIWINKRMMAGCPINIIGNIHENHELLKQEQIKNKRLDRSKTTLII